MNYFIVDDDPAVRGTLTNLIEKELDAEIVGTAEDGAEITAYLLNEKSVDILLIDLLMPERDGLETLEAIYPQFQGKTVMISQVETKEMVANAYENSVEAYITKPVNRLEVLSVLQRIEKSLTLEKSMKQIQNSLKLCNELNNEKPSKEFQEDNLCSEQVLSDLGIRYEKGSDDLMLIADLLHERNLSAVPPLKELWEMVVCEKTADKAACKKEMKATEQRVRRAAQHSFNHIAYLGAMDMSHPKFEHYGMTFFDLDQLQARISEIRHDNSKQEKLASRLNIRKFVSAFYDESRTAEQ